MRRALVCVAFLLLGEAAHAQGVRVEELLNALGEKYPADDQADQEDGGGGVSCQDSP